MSRDDAVIHRPRTFRANVHFRTCVLVVASLCLSPAWAGVYQWRTVLWGGGGYVTGLVPHPTVAGLQYARTDNGGAYRRDPGSLTWTPLLDTLPPSDAHLQSVLSVAVDPSNDQLLYLAAGFTTQSWGRHAALLWSADRGHTWAQAELPIGLDGGLEAGRVSAGEHLQVDPNLGSVLLLGTSRDGLFRSADAGRTWTRLAAFPNEAVALVALDHSSGKPGSPTPHVFAATDTVLYHSMDAGATWSPVAGQPSNGSGLRPMAACVNERGLLYVTFADSAGAYDATDGRVFTYANGTWTDITPPTLGVRGGFGAVSVSVRSPDLVAVATTGRAAVAPGGDEIYRSLNGGRTWTAVRARSTQTANGSSGWVGDGRSGVGALALDPLDESVAVFAFGSGLWQTDDFLCPRPRWQFRTDGLLQTHVAALASPASGAHLFLTQGGNVTGSVADSHGLDYAHWWPNFMARTMDALLWLSWDNGLNWTPLDVNVHSTDIGRVAVSASGSNLFWVPGGSDALMSSDNGRTWVPATGYPKSEGLRSGQFYTPIADRHADGAFYTFDHVGGRLLESVDGGRTFGVAYTGLITFSRADSARLVSLPTQERDLWLATDAGLYWFQGRAASAPVRLGSVEVAFGFGYGAAHPGGQYPTLFLSGRVSGVTGLFRSLDQGTSWERIDAPGQYGADRPDLIAGDQRVFGRVWVAPGGRGITMGTLA